MCIQKQQTTRAMKKDKVLPIRLNEDQSDRILQLQQGYQEMTGIKLSKAEIIIRLVNYAYYEDVTLVDILQKRFINNFGDLMHFTDK